MRVRRRYHLGVPGLVYVFLTLLVALGAFNSQNNLLFWAFGFGLSLLVVSGFLSGAMLMGLDLEREPIAPGVVNEPITLHYRLTNRNRIVPAFALSIAEVAPRAQGADRSFRARLVDFLVGPARRNLGVNWARHIGAPLAFVPYVGARQTVHGDAVVMAKRRGEVRFGRVLVSTSFPFGIVKKSLLFEQEQAALVRPSVSTLDPGVLTRATRTGDRGVSPTRRSGPGEEFFALREYVPGDSPSGIAWRASARGGRLLVRQTAAPSPVRLWIGLHLGTAASKQADEAAISLAAGLVDLAIGRGMEVGFFAPQAGVVMKPREGRRQREQIFDRLARIDLDAKPGNPGWREAPLWSDAIGSESAAFEQGRVICIVVHSRTANEQWGPPKSVHIVAREFTSVPPVAIGAATVGLGTDSPEGSALNGHAVVRPAGVSTG